MPWTGYFRGTGFRRNGPVDDLDDVRDLCENGAQIRSRPVKRRPASERSTPAQLVLCRSTVNQGGETRAREDTQFVFLPALLAIFSL